MALKTRCQTPGAVYHTEIHEDEVVVTVKFPPGHKLDLTKTQADLLESNIHNAMEIILSRYFLKEGVNVAKFDEVSPPGFKGTVRAIKRDHAKGKNDIDNPYALAWHMKKKGDKSHYKDKAGTPEKKESVLTTFRQFCEDRGYDLER